MFFTSLWFLKDVFTGYRILGGQYIFFFQYYKNLYHILLFSMVSGEKSTVIQIHVLLFNVTFFSGCVQDFFLCLYLALWLWCFSHGFVWVLSAWSSLRFLNLCVSVLYQIWGVFSQILFSTTVFIFSFQNSTGTNVGSFDITPQNPDALLINFSSLSIRLDYFHCSIFRFTDSFLCSSFWYWAHPVCWNFRSSLLSQGNFPLLIEAWL